MLVKDIIKLLIQGELKPLDISDVGVENNRTPDQEEHTNSLVRMINSANITIHEKFALIQKECVLRHVRHNVGLGLPRDFIHPLSAALENGCEVPLNNERKFMPGQNGQGLSPLSSSPVTTIGLNDTGLSLMFPAPFTVLVKGTAANGTFPISLLYVAAPRDVEDPKDDVRLPSNLIQLLLDYVAYKAYIGVDGHIEGVNNTYYRRFLAGCQAVKETGLHSSSDNLDSNVKLLDRGFV